jgi:hypothetical protein
MLQAVVWPLDRVDVLLLRQNGSGKSGTSGSNFGTEQSFDYESVVVEADLGPQNARMSPTSRVPPKRIEASAR